MHYVPPNWQAEATAPDVAREDLADHPALPLFLLTGLIGLLLGADTLLEWINVPAWLPYRSPWGIRLSLIAAILGGARILYLSLEGLFAGRIGAELALTIACLAAIVLREPGVAALVVFIALFGESLEGYIAGRAQQAIRGLFQLRPRLAHVIRDGQEYDLPLDQILVGETLVIRPGERLPVDGSVLTGRSTIDQSALTGESIPVDKRPGDAVYTGTLNQLGALTIVVEKTGRETTFGQIIEHVAAATAQKTQLERLADRLARYFLPTVLLAALLTLVGWRLTAGNWRAGTLPALAVLVVACPCPLILATPSAVLAALAWLARSGIVLKSSAALERLAEVDTIAWDKTGTLTTGQLRIGEIFSLPHISPEAVLHVAATAEQASEHLLARVLCDEARRRRLPVGFARETQTHPGAGVVTRIAPNDLPESVRQQTQLLSQAKEARITVGNQRCLEQLGLTTSPLLAGWLQALDDSGQTPLIVAVEDQILGVIGVRDTVRAEARELLAQLRTDGIREMALLTGDRAAAARLVQSTVGPLEHVATEQLPLDKARWVAAQHAAGQRVLMIGDGINDAPALAAAYVGLAVGNVGSQIAAEAGDLVLLGPSLAPLPGLIRLSRQFARIIRQSIFWFAFGLNGLGVLASALGWLSPVSAAIFHEIASLAVMFNALRLLWFERWEQTSLGSTCSRCLQQLDAGLEALTPARWASQLVRHSALLSRLLLAGVGIWWLTSNVIWVGTAEHALVTRFGKQVATLAPGLYWRWPAPFEQVYRQPLSQVRVLQIGFRSAGTVETVDDIYAPPIEWQANHQEPGHQPVAAESEFLTGEELPIELTAEIFYDIADFKQFQFGTVAPEEFLRTLAEGVLRRQFLRLPLDPLLTTARPQLEAHGRRELQRLVDAARLGVRIVDVQLLDLHPPVAIVPDYRRVADALEERERLLNEADVTVARELITAAGESGIDWLQQHAAEPHAAPHTRSSPSWKMTPAAWAELLTLHNGRTRLSGQAAADILTAEREQLLAIAAAHAETARVSAIIDATRDHPELARMQLYWQALADSLGKLRLTLLDPQAVGRRQYWLRDEVSPPDLPPPLRNPAPPQRPPEVP